MDSIPHIAGDIAHDIGHGIHVGADAVAHGAVDVVHGIQSTISAGQKLIRVIHDGRELTPAFKAELATLTDDAKEIAAILGPVLATQGKVVSIDLAAIEPAIEHVVKLVRDFVTFLPTLESAVSKISADIK